MTETIRPRRGAAVLVRLPEVDPDELTELLTAAWRTRAPRRIVAEYDATA